MPDSNKTLVIIFGPPAVGKMTVGLALEGRTGLKLFHNHMSVDIVLRFFPFGTPPFRRLVGEFRRRMFEEVAASDLPGMIFTYVWALDDPHDRAFVDETSAIFRAHGARVCFVELVATQEERLRRNGTELRLREKAPKRDLDRSRQLLLDADVRYQLNTKDDFFYPADFLRIENTSMSADDAAQRIADYFGLVRIT
jgi:hypothetical protein